MDRLEFDVRIKQRDLYDYMLRHAYHSAQGLLGSCVGVLAIFMFLSNHQVLYLIMGIVILLYLPWTLYLKSGQQAANNPAFKEPLHYVLDEEGISVSQGEEATNALVEKFKNLIAENATVENVDEWGKRKLAYLIDDEAEGYYVLVNFESEADFPAELDRITNITDGVLRSMIIKK